MKSSKVGLIATILFIAVFSIGMKMEARWCGTGNQKYCLISWLERIGKDDEQAVNSLLKAAEQGDAVAQNNLGFDYDNGYGVKKNYIEAFKWYSIAAEQGNADAQRHLGDVYYYGYFPNVKEDTEEGCKLWRKAAVQGDAKAQKRLSMCTE